MNRYAKLSGVLSGSVCGLTSSLHLALRAHQLPLRAGPDALTEYGAMQVIHRLVNTPVTISAGYNSLAFDDYFLRFGFFRNLLPPYSHHWCNGCRRINLYPVTILYRLFATGVLAWPEVEGRTSFKLKHLGAANNLAIGRAHDALTDVEATVTLARRLWAKPAIWRYCLGYFDRQVTRQRIANLQRQSLGDYSVHSGVLVDGRFGCGDNFNVPALYLGDSEHYGNQALWLRLGQGELAEMSVAGAPVVRRRVGVACFVLPRRYGRLDGRRQELVATNLAWLEEKPARWQRLVELHQAYKHPPVPDVDADGALYRVGFWSPHDQVLCRRFHAAPLPQKRKLARRFDHPVARTLATRILARNFDLGEEPWRARFQARPPVDFRGERHRTVPEVLAEIASLRAERGRGKQTAILDDLAEHLGRGSVQPAATQLREGFGAYGSTITTRQRLPDLVAVPPQLGRLPR